MADWGIALLKHLGGKTPFVLDNLREYTINKKEAEAH